MKAINFIQNYNGKLDKEEFTTIRLFKEGFLNIGDEVRVTVGREPKKRKVVLVGFIESVKVVYIWNLTNQQAQKDIGRNADYLTNLLQMIYKDKVHDWSTQKLAIFSIRVLKRKYGVQMSLGLS